MLFTSWSFVLFFGIVFFLYYLLPYRFRWALLLLVSYYFYACWNYKLLALLAGTTLLTYACGRCIAAAGSARGKRLAMAIGVAMPLLALFYFKYFNFATETVNAIATLFPLSLRLPAYTIILPIGISFYTFKTISYVIDVYRGKMRVEKHVGMYALYVSFFPQLLAGPIERPENLLPQFREEHAFDYAGVTYGLKTMAWGYFKKMIIADALAVYVDTVYNAVTQYRGLTLIVATILFSIQIYCDFSGYSDIAIGAARMLGFTGMQNFLTPYFSKSVRSFWRRWHISLSSWFMDYIYIPLGGNRVRIPRYYCNLFITFLVSGLWHGANWTFVLWGALHGVYIIVGQITKNVRARAYTALHIRRDGWFAGAWQTVVTFALVTVAWIFFRANSLSDALYVITHLHNAILVPALNISRAVRDLLGTDSLAGLWLLLPIAVLTAFDWCSRKEDAILRIGRLPTVWRWALYIAFAILFILYAPETQTASQFIYFQF